MEQKQFTNFQRPIHSEEPPFPVIKENVENLKKWLLEQFANSAFKTDGQFPAMSGKPAHISRKQSLKLNTDLHQSTCVSDYFQVNQYLTNMLTSTDKQQHPFQNQTRCAWQLRLHFDPGVDQPMLLCMIYQIKVWNFKFTHFSLSSLPSFLSIALLLKKFVWSTDSLAQQQLL